MSLKLKKIIIFILLFPIINIDISIVGKRDVGSVFNSMMDS